MSALIGLLRNVPLFQDLTEEELRTISPLFQENKWNRGKLLFMEGDPGDELFVVKSGVVKIYRFDDEKEIILALFGPGDFFGEMAVIQPALNRSATAETLESCSIYTMKRSVFYEFMEKHPRICIKLLEVTVQRLRNANDQIYNLTFLDVRSRIIRTILRLAEERGVKLGDGLLVDIRMTHQQLASFAGTARESATKVLQELSEEGMIIVEKKRIFLPDHEKLKELAGL
ncbi:Crp/Fnr family transcriptional regulator [Paenibacillus antri]|uniref:Crp/Fnr family transcriptional regulator n=1 Tax=Paenibacillus antri TaxID=2582848 RepID=A0A5R9G3T3_9BACL|nr:Crp/Fnr family transcriptional regulator [Paenibacillus antri]TLS49669.1 Crp/Fnr family transcriptional regulator [Paenibacillus antri]